MLIQTVLSAILAMSIPGGSLRGTALFGRISDGSTPVTGAIVTISNRGFVKSTTTDGNGRFILEAVPAGRYDFRTSALGYAVLECPVVVRGGDSHGNWIGVTALVPVDRQTVSVVELKRRQPPKVVPNGDRGQVANRQESR
jgi:Carboxypeptidase regulatory-like domain